MLDFLEEFLHLAQLLALSFQARLVLEQLEYPDLHQQQKAKMEARVQ